MAGMEERSFTAVGCLIEGNAKGLGKVAIPII